MIINLTKRISNFFTGKKVENHGDILNGMLLTVTLSASEKDIIAVRAEHFT